MAEKNTLAEKAADKICELISERGLKPGEKIGTEKELTERMDVSRSTIREAIRILVSRNVLETRQGSGTFVSDRKGVIEDPLGLSLLHDKFKLTWDLLEIRMFLEPQMAYMAAINATEEQLNRLCSICHQMDALSDRGLERSEADTQFHIVILEASGNMVAPNLYPILEKAVQMFIHYTHRESAREQMATHRDILEGLLRRDPEWARDMMSMHLAFNRKELRRVALERGENLNLLKGGKSC